MVTRKQLREEIERHVERLKRGETAERQRDEETVPAAADEPDTPAVVGVRGFVPSRGDESYLYRPKDPELAAACSAALDACERLDEVIWRKLEENRE